MNKEQFLEAFKDVLQRDENLTLDMALEDIDEWDSLSKMATIAFVDKEFGYKLTFADYDEMVTVSDIVNKIGL